MPKQINTCEKMQKDDKSLTYELVQTIVSSMNHYKDMEPYFSMETSFFKRIM